MALVGLPKPPDSRLRGCRLWHVAGWLTAGVVAGLAGADLPTAVAEAEKTATPARQPVPEPAAVAQAEALVRDVYQKEFAAGDLPSEKLELAARFYDEATKTNDNPAARFALLKLAQQLAVEAGDAELIVRAINEAGRHFEFDVAAVRRAVLLKAAENPRNSAVARSMAEACLRLTDRAEAAEQFDLAMDYGKAAYTAARNAKDPGLVEEIVARGREVLARKAEHEQVLQAQKTLAVSPDDAEANLLAGRYACLVREDWRRGLPRLAKGSDAELREAALLDLAAPTDAPDQIAVADRWWELAQQRAEAERNVLLRRAAHWYRAAQPGATGLDKSKATSRLAEVRGFGKPSKPAPAPARSDEKPDPRTSRFFEAAEGQWADVLATIEPRKHGLAGDWAFKGGKLLGAPNAKAPAAGMSIPIRPTGSYALQIAFTRTAGDGMIGLILPVGRRRCVAVLDCRPGIHGIDTIGGGRADDNESTARGVLKTGREYALEIDVKVDGTEAAVTVNLDNRPLFFYRGPAAALDLHKDFVVKGQRGIGLVARCGAVFHAVRLRVSSGKAALAP